MSPTKRSSARPGPEERESVKRLGDRVIRSIARDLVVSGEFDPRASSLAELIGASRASLVEMLDSGERFGLVRDHEAGLLHVARRYAKDDRTEYAVMFYATFIEHRLNGMIEIRSKDLGFDHGAVISAIRKTVSDKTSEVWDSLFDVPFPVDLRSAILATARRRNDFVHYRWQPLPDISLGIVARQDVAAIEQAEWIVSELESLERRLEPAVPSEVAAWLYG